MAWAHVQTIKQLGAGFVASPSITMTGGNMIVVVLAGFRGAGWTVTGISDGTNTYEHRASLQLASLGIEIWSSNSVAGGSRTVDPSVSGAMDAGAFFVSEYSYTGTVSVDTTDTGSGTSSTPTSGNFNTTANNALLVGGLAVDAGGTLTITEGTNWTIPTNGDNEDGSGINIPSGTEYQLNKGAATYACEWTIGSSSAYAIAVVAFSDGSGGGGDGKVFIPGVLLAAAS